jgi:hypothetical protein
MAVWPDVDQVKRRLGITRTDAGSDVDVQLALDAAIETVEQDAADWLAGTFPADQASDPVASRTPDARLASAALLLAVSTYKAPDAPFGVAGVFDTAAIAVRDQLPQYIELMRGHRSDFGVG